MKHSFFLRNPKAKTTTSILFSCNFSREKKRFKYSTKTSINPYQWNFKTNLPKNKGKGLAQNHIAITKVLNKFTNEFYNLQSRCEMMNIEFTYDELKTHFDSVFGNTRKRSDFFGVYDLFVEEKIKRKEWSDSTVKRYQNIKSLLLEFEQVKKYKLTFPRINQKFYTELIDFCYEYRNHYVNTFNRNLGLIKTFLFWSLENEYHYNVKFKKFKKPQRVLTREETLNLDDIYKIIEFDCGDAKLNKVKDIFVFQCLTGMRYGELKAINKRTVIENQYILLKEDKDIAKETRQIPLTTMSLQILLKYNYKLPLISNQKQNNYIKEVMEKVGYTQEVEFSRTKGVQKQTFVKRFCDRISTHTARRSFITIMRNKGIADKTIMGISGHKHIKTFHMYHQVDDVAKIEAVKTVFDKF